MFKSVTHILPVFVTPYYMCPWFDIYLIDELQVLDSTSEQKIINL